MLEEGGGVRVLEGKGSLEGVEEGLPRPVKQPPLKKNKPFSLFAALNYISQEKTTLECAAAH